MNFTVVGNNAVIQRLFDFADIRKSHAISGLIRAIKRQIIKAQHDILGRHDNRFTVCRAQNVVGRHHQHARFKLSFKRQRHMHRHLIAIKVSIKSCTNQRMKVDGLALDKDRFKGLKTKSMERRCAV